MPVDVSRRDGSLRTPSLAVGVASGPETYFPAFDWLRFVLATVVMLSHFGLWPAWPNISNFAVQVFFALSGWLIGGILLRSSPADLPRFYFDRVVRIWIPYYLGFALLTAASLLKDTVTAKWIEFNVYFATFTWNLFGIQQLATSTDLMPLRGTGNHYWSVNAEEQFYLLAPLLLVLASARFGRSLLVWGVLGLAAVNTQLYGAIVLGVNAAIVGSRFPGFQQRWQVIAGAIGVIAIGAMLLVGGATYERVAPPCALAIVLLLARPGRKHRLAAFAGGLSYQLYLNHWVGAFAAAVILRPFGLRDSVASVILACAISIGLAAALYNWIDRPLLANRRWLFTPRRGRYAMMLGYGIVAAGILFGLVVSVAQG